MGTLMQASYDIAQTRKRAAIMRCIHGCSTQGAGSDASSANLLEGGQEYCLALFV